MKSVIVVLFLLLSVCPAQARISHNVCKQDAQNVALQHAGGRVNVVYFYTTSNYSEVEIYKVAGFDPNEIVVSEWSSTTQKCESYVAPYNLSSFPPL